MTSSTSADSRRKGELGGADSEAKSDMGIVITFYWKVGCSARQLLKKVTGSQWRKKRRWLFCEMRLEESNGIGKAGKWKAKF